MPKRSLLKTNPFLLEPKKRLEMFQMTVYTSTDIEGVKLTELDLKGEKKRSNRTTPNRGSVKSSESRR